MDPYQTECLKDGRARHESDLRHTALAQACHDLKGNASAEEVVKRAKVYFDFLRPALNGR